MAWGIGGWLLTPFLQKIGAERREAPRPRGGGARDHLRQPLREGVSLAEALALDAIAVYGRAATGEKYLIDPSRSG